MINQFRRGLVLWFNSERGLGRLMGDITFSSGDARHPQIIGHQMFYGPVGGAKLPDPKKGDILIYEIHPENDHEVRFWGYQREFFLEIWNDIRSHEDWCPSCGHPKNVHATTRDGCAYGHCTCELWYRDGLDELLRQQMMRDFDRDIEEQSDLWSERMSVEEGQSKCVFCGHQLKDHTSGGDRCMMDGCLCGDEEWEHELESQEPQQVWFTEGPMGHNGYQ